MNRFDDLIEDTVAAGLGAATDPTPPDRFFEKQTGLLAATLAQAVLDDGPIAAGPARELWRYHEGVWLADGADEVRRRVKAKLKERWRSSHATTIIDALACEEPFISDTQPTDWINCSNGLLDWRNGTLGPHTPEVPTTYQLAVPWNPAATCPTVDAWLAQVAPDDAIDLIWEVIGVAVYADMPFHRAIMLVGPGRNGKGTLLRLIRSLIGGRHVSSVTLQSLAENRFAAASLFGKVANLCGDLDARTLVRSDLFKQVTGGDTIPAERKFGHSFDFRVSATMIFAANELPGSKDLTDGFFSRWVIVPFTKLKLEAGKEDPSIEARMQTELQGVLVKAIEGLRRLMARGAFEVPASVAEASTSYREHADPMRRFADDCLTITGDHTHRVVRKDVYAAYDRWCKDNGHSPLGAGKFYAHLAAAFPTINVAAMSMGLRYVAGAYLRTPDAAF